MGITYNKQYTAKDRRIVTHGPADRQRAQAAGGADPALVNELMSQVKLLQEQLASKPAPEGMYTPEQVDEEIIKAIKSETADLRAKNEVAMNNLGNEITGLKEKAEALVGAHKKELASQKDIIKNKEEMIQQLRDNKDAGGISEDKLTALLAEATKKIEDMAMTSQGLSQADVDPNRPKMEAVFVDPIEVEEKRESHIKVEDVTVDKREQMAAKVDKLKGLMGKLPTKKG
jgi:hypothetical protein